MLGHGVSDCGSDDWIFWTTTLPVVVVHLWIPETEAVGPGRLVHQPHKGRRHAGFHEGNQLPLAGRPGGQVRRSVSPTPN